MMRKMILGVVLLTVLTNAFADIMVSDVKVFSGCPWEEVVVGYTIKGTTTEAAMIKLIASDKSANKTYTAQSLTCAVLTEGRHVLRWDAAAEGAKFSSTNVVFSVLIVPGGVQLWADGPYWAEYNVGATRPEDRGYYFKWGDTVGYKRNASNDGWVSVVDGSPYSFTLYSATYEKDISQLNSLGYIDSTGNLVAAHDAATEHLGVLWRMPTAAEFSALCSNCTITRTVRNGVSGFLVSGIGEYAAKSIFFPMTGYASDSFLYNDNSPYYWSSTPDSNNSKTAQQFIEGCDVLSYNRTVGIPVRPVLRFAK